MMASLREYYRNMAEENARLQEELRQIRAEQSVLNVDDTLQALNELGVDTDDQ